MKHREPGTVPLWWELFGLPVFVAACVIWAIASGALIWFLVNAAFPA